MDTEIRRAATEDVPAVAAREQERATMDAASVVGALDPRTVLKVA
jgi:hypothetical protein